MRTKYIGFVKTSFSSPSLPFRIGGYAPKKNSQFPSFTHPPRTSTLRSRRIRKRAKLHSEKANTRTKGNISIHHFLDSFAALFRRSSQSKGAVRGCAKSRIKSWEEMLNFPRLFSFSLRFFREQRHSSIDFSRRCPQTPTATAQTRSQRNCTRPTFLRKTNDGTTSRCRFCAQPIAQLACVSHPPSVSFAHKKTATHLPMDSCLKECGR